LQCVAVCCSVLQCVAKYRADFGGCVLQCVAVCCSVLQCVAVCCSVSQCVAVCHGEIKISIELTLQNACCSVLQFRECVTMYYDVLHCDTV